MKKSSQNIIDNAAENKLQKQMQTLVDNTLDYAIFILDTQGRVVTWNKGAERIQGYQPHEIIGKHFSCFYEKDAILKHHPEKELEMARKNDRHEEEGFRVRKDGTRFFAHVIIMDTYIRADLKRIGILFVVLTTGMVALSRFIN